MTPPTPILHPIHSVTSFRLAGPFVLDIAFEDGLTRTIDFAPILSGEIYGPLADPGEFARVTIDPEVRTLVWPSGADFDPATLQDWPVHEAAWMARSRASARRN